MYQLIEHISGIHHDLYSLRYLAVSLKLGHHRPFTITNLLRDSLGLHSPFMCDSMNFMIQGEMTCKVDRSCPFCQLCCCVRVLRMCIDSILFWTFTTYRHTRWDRRRTRRRVGHQDVSRSWCVSLARFQATLPRHTSVFAKVLCQSISLS